MANYVYVENNIPVEFYDFLPKSWRNISGLNLTTDETYLNSIGFYKVIKNEINYNPNNQKIIRYDYTFVNNNVYETPVIENFEPKPENKQVPNRISATQIRLWLVKNNISLDSVQNAINTVEDESIKTELNVKWEYAPYFERNNPFINQIGSILGLDSDKIDQAFIEAVDY